MTMNQSALDSSDLGEYFRYPQRDEKVFRKFLETSEVKNFPQKWQNPEISKPHFELEKMDFCPFHVFAPSACV